MSNELRNFLALSYDELEQLNLKAKEQRQKRVDAHKIQEERSKAVCTCWTTTRSFSLKAGTI